MFNDRELIIPPSSSASLQRRGGLTGPFEIQEKVDFLRRCLPNQDFLNFHKTGKLEIAITESHKEVLDTPLVGALAVNLKELSKFKGFDRLLAGFNNPSQFLDTVFEAQTANYLTYVCGAKNLDFSPDCKTDKGIKRPDFRLTMNGQKFTCECKSLRFEESKFAARFKNIFNSICSSLNTSLLSRHERIDISCDTGFCGDLSVIATELCNRVHEAIEKKDTTEHKYKSFRFRISKRSSQGSFTDFDFLLAQVALPIPTHFVPLDLSNSTVVMTGIDSGLRKKISSLLKDANEQIPGTHSGIIFLEVNRTKPVKWAANELLLKTSFSNIYFIAIFGRESSLVSRNVDEEHIKQLFKYQSRFLPRFKTATSQIAKRIPLVRKAIPEKEGLRIVI